MLQSNRGFTLIETLFVLSIFFLIISLSFLLVRPQFAYLDKQLFFSQFKQDLFNAQQYAISNNKIVNVNIFPSSHRYYVKDQEGKYIIDRIYSDKVKILAGSQNLYFRYNFNGNINTFGSLYIIIGNKQYKFTFHIGKGRFYVVQS